MSERIPVFKGRVVDLGIERVALPNGKTMDLEVVRHPGAAAVLPIHEDGSVTLIYQYRHAGGGMHYEVPAGTLEAGEVPELCARRELQEEVGLSAKSLEQLAYVHTTPGFTDELIYLYVATGLTQGETNLDEHEVIQPVRMPLESAVQMILDGDITDAKTIISLLLAEKARG